MDYTHRIKVANCELQARPRVSGQSGGLYFVLHILMTGWHYLRCRLWLGLT